MKGRILLLIYSAFLAFAAALPVGAADIAWTNNAGGNWHVAANWNPNQVPGPNDRAIIASAGNYTVTLDGNAYVDSLLLGGIQGGQAITISGSALSVSGLTTVNSNGLLAIVGGSIGGSGDIFVEGVFNMFGGALTGSQPIVVFSPGQVLFGGDVNLGGRLLTNSGRVIWTSGNISNLSSFINLSNGIVDVLAVTNNTLTGGSFSNAGRVRRTLGTNAVTFDLGFSNSGTVDLQSGTLILSKGGSNAGRFTIAATATLQIGSSPFLNHPFEFSTSSSITGAGNVTFRSFAAIVNGTFSVAGTNTFIGGTIDLSSGYSISNAPIAILSGTVNFNSGRMLFPSRLVLQGGGRLAGSDSMTVTGEVALSTGVIQSSGVINAGSGFAILAGGDITMLSGTLNNAGVSVLSGALRLISNSVLNNLQGATIRYSGAAFLGQPGLPGTFNNYGLFLKSGSLLLGVAAPCNNYGEMDIQGGTLFLSEGGTHSGSFRVGVGATLRFDPGFFGAQHTLLEGSQVTGDGNVGFGTSTDVKGSIAVGGAVSIVAGTNNFTGAFTNGGSITISGGLATFNTGEPILPGGLTVSGGVLDGGDPITARGPMSFTGGTLRGSGAINANGGLTIGGTTLLLDGRTLNNGGVASWNGGLIFTGGGSVISNAASGLFNINFDGQTFAGFGGSRRFINAGVLRKSGGSGTAVISDAFYNSGTVESLSGDLAFGNVFAQTAGSTLLNGGNLSATGPLQIMGGVLGGNGSVSATVVNSGRIVPGSSASLLRIQGDYTQTSSGHLDLELGGSTPGIGFDQLQVQGTASLAGTLNVSSIGGFHPAIGETFRVLTFASRTGDFSVFNDLTGSDLHRIYDGNGLNLAASNSSPVLVISHQASAASGTQPAEIVLTWTDNEPGYLLQSATNIPSTTWVTIPSSGTNRVILPATAPQRFFRLIKP